MYVRYKDKCVFTACAYHPWAPSTKSKNKIPASNKQMPVTLMEVSVLAINDAGADTDAQHRLSLTQPPRT